MVSEQVIAAGAQDSVDNRGKRDARGRGEGRGKAGERPGRTCDMSVRGLSGFRAFSALQRSASIFAMRVYLREGRRYRRQVNKCG